MNDATPSTEELARRVAHIMGDSSGAGQAVALLDRYRTAGFPADIFYLATKSTWVVGPPLPAPPEPRS